MSSPDDHNKTPSELNDHELCMLESTLRVQLQVTKHVRVAQVSSVVGATVLSGPFGAIPTGVSIVTSQVHRRKLKRRHREVLREMDTRDGLKPMVNDTKRLGKRAYAISIATGLACCLLAFSADLLIDCAVIEVMSEVILDSVDDVAMSSLGVHITKQITAPAPLKETRSWSGFTSKWKAKRAHKKTQSLPPDLFGEMERRDKPLPDLFGETEYRESFASNLFGNTVEVHRTRAYTLYGECVVLRFTTILPHDEEMSRRSTRTTIVGEHEAISEDQWRKLWTLEDSPTDANDDDADAFNLFGTDLRSMNSMEDDDYDLFGATVAEKVKTYGLFGSHA